MSFGNALEDDALGQFGIVAGMVDFAGHDAERRAVATDKKFRGSGTSFVLRVRAPIFRWKPPCVAHDNGELVCLVLSGREEGS